MLQIWFAAHRERGRTSGDVGRGGATATSGRAESSEVSKAAGA